MASNHEQRRPCTAVELLFKVVLTGWQSHYENRGIFDEKRMLHLKEASKQVLEKTQKEVEVRRDLGHSLPIWQHITDVLTAAIPMIEQLCFMYKSPSGAQFNGSSTEFVAANSFTLINDLERMHDLCIISRNITSATTKAQNYAAESGIDQQVLKLIDISIKVTARGFDGTNGTAEDRYSMVCDMFKRVLISCLQFLHNFVMRNEHRKLVLWLDLFGYSQQVDNVAVENTSTSSSKRDLPIEVVNNDNESPNSARIMSAVQKLQSNGELKEGPGYDVDDVHALFDMISMEKPMDKATQDAARVLMDRITADMEKLSKLSVNELDGDLEALLKVGAALRSQLPAGDPISQSSENDRGNHRKGRGSSHSQEKTGQWSGLPDLSSYGSLLVDQEITEDDLAMPRTSRSAAETLQEAKDELMARLQDTAPLPDEQADQSYDDSSQIAEHDTEEDIPESAEDSMDEEEEEDEDYHNANDQDKGLLTDIPLVLGPTEIEALPMIIQAGIVDRFGSNNSNNRQGLKNMQSVRCHILLAQEAGRNVLRELLIFIAAWDLPDDELYFKMMVQIMEAILKNGLMSHAYSDFGQAKDIISPAQAVLIKILTHIYRAKYSPSAAQNNDQAPQNARLPEVLTRTDILTVRYIFTVFRGNIIPETCALIYLQGQIRAGLAMAEDFPLNLWDMERVYEGVYQFLEFFAVLTENNDWKRLLIEWEIVYDLVTLLKELDASISKAPLSATSSSQARQTTPATQPISTPSTIVQSQPPSATTPTVERPYDSSTPISSNLPPPPPPPQPTAATQSSDANENSNANQQTASPPVPTQSEEPSTFEWRNLKKLIVLVLSSLVWKSPIVQRQIRDHNGVECILSCTKYDGFNPYIKEHAVMCLKFLLEGSKENQEIVRGLEARGVANQQEVEREFGIKASVRGGKIKVENVGGASGMHPGMGMGMGMSMGMAPPRRSMRDRRASESNAAAELLGEKFARLNADMGQSSRGLGHRSQPREGGRVITEVLDDEDDDENDEGEELDSDEDEEEDGDVDDDDDDEEDDEEDEDDIEFM